VRREMWDVGRETWNVDMGRGTWEVGRETTWDVKFGDVVSDWNSFKFCIGSRQLNQIRLNLD